jgi:hypothetical protein
MINNRKEQREEEEEEEEQKQLHQTVPSLQFQMIQIS